MSTTTQDNGKRLNKILSWITTSPRKSQTRQIITLQLILAWAVVIAIGYAIAYQILFQEPPIAPMWRLVLFVIIYAISRTRYYLASVFAVIMWVIFQPYTTLIFPETQRELLMMVMISVTPIPLAGLLLSKRLLYFVTGLVVVNLMLVWVIIPNIDPLIVLILFMISTVLFIWSIIWADVIHGNQSTAHPYAHLVDMSPDIMAIVVKNQFTYINPAGLQLLGTTNDAIIGKSLNTILPFANADTSNSSKYVIGTSHLGNMMIQSVETIQPIEGNGYRAIVTLTPFEQEGSMATLFTAKSLPPAISQSQQILESTVAMTAVHQDNKIVYINSQFERLTGYSREEIYASDYRTLNLIHHDDIAQVSLWMSELQQGISKTDNLEYRIKHKDGSDIWLNCTGRIIRHAGKPALLTTALDITSYRTESPLKLIQNTIPFPWLLIKNQDGVMTIVDYHTANIEWFADNTTLIGQPVSQLITDLPQSLELLRNRTPTSNSPSTQRSVFKSTSVGPIPIEWKVAQLDINSHADFLITLRKIDYETRLENDLLRYRTMFDMMNDYAYLTKVLPDGQIELLWVSDAFRKITGYDPYVEAFPSVVEKTIHPLDTAIMESHISHLLRGEMSVVEHRVVTKSGQTRWLRTYGYPEVENDRTTMIYGAVSDITELVNAQDTVKNSALQQSVIAEIGMVAVRDDLDIQDFTKQANNLVTQLMMVPWCVIVEYHPDLQKFTVHSIVGKTVPGEIESKPDDESSFLGYVLHQNDPVLVPDWSKETRFKPPNAYVELGIKTSLSVVIPMHDKPFGIINIHDTAPREFSGSEINLLQTVANIIGTYIQQRRTQATMQEQRIITDALIDIAAVLSSQTELNDILELILNSMSRIVPTVDSSNIMLIDHERDVATVAIRHNANPDVPFDRVGIEIPLSDMVIVSQVIKSGEPALLNNVNEVDDWYTVPSTEWIQSYLSIPIFAGADCIGVINLDSGKLNAFTTDHVKQIEAFLDQASIAIQNAQHAENLVKEVEKRTRELQAERAQLQAILNSTGEGIFYSRNYIMMFTNETLSEMMGYKAEEMMGHSSFMFRPDDLSASELKVREIANQSLETNGLARTEFRLKRKDGTTFIAGLTISRVLKTDNVFENVTVVRDINREKEIEAQKETFISNAAHELRNPITTLNTRLYLMKNTENITQEHVEKLEVVVQKMNALVAGLLDMSRFESGRIQLNLQSVILQTVINDVMTYQIPEAEKKQMTVTYTVPDTPITMIADSLRFNQVLTNFVSNSINYTLEKGHITVTADYVDESHEMVVIEVADNGIGIDKESLKTIFQPFSQAHNNRTNTGTGLGLSISKQIVEAHGGHIKVESVEGEGSRFILYMPTTAIDQNDS